MYEKSKALYSLSFKTISSSLTFYNNSVLKQNYLPTNLMWMVTDPIPVQ